MKAITLIKPCLLACSFLAGAHAFANPGTVNSIQFSFMNYSTTPSPFYSSSTGSSLDLNATVLPAPLEGTSLTAPVQAPQILPVIEIFVPSLPERGGTAPLADVALPVEQLAVIPEPGSVALLGLGLGLLAWRRRGGRHA